MKITRVKWNNHPILGNLQLDFVNSSTGEPFETVVLAGENGTGKSAIFEALSTFLNIGSFEYFEYIEYVIDSKKYKALQPEDNVDIKDFFDIVDENNNVTKIRSNSSNNRSEINTNEADIRYYGCIFSKARSDYRTKKITSTGTSTLDVDKYDNDLNDDFTSLKQLIVDVQNQDNASYTQEHKNLGPDAKPWDEFYPTSKIFRFENSFNNFFNNLSYDKVADIDAEKTIQFTKNGRSISIDNLSTGEKQIVFRGIYLLKNSNMLNGAAIMIDEPELSMHPKWQQKILKY